MMTLMFVSNQGVIVDWLGCHGLFAIYGGFWSSEIRLGHSHEKILSAECQCCCFFLQNSSWRDFEVFLPGFWSNIPTQLESGFLRY